MKTFFVVLISLACGFALADDAEETSAEGFHEVQIRLVTFEQIDVTSDKAPAESVEPVGGEIEAILRAAEVLEADETEQ